MGEPMGEAIPETRCDEWETQYPRIRAEQHNGKTHKRTNGTINARGQVRSISMGETKGAPMRETMPEIRCGASIWEKELSPWFGSNNCLTHSLMANDP